ncbi:MAG: hypothetical protein AB1728_05965 [Bacteroidota bacterium]
METQNDKQMFKQIAMLLIQADKYVKEGRLSAALEKIAEARTHDPAHLYAIAYEERVKALMLNHKKAEAHCAEQKESLKSNENSHSSNGHSLETQVLKESTIPQSSPHSAPPIVNLPTPVNVEDGKTVAPSAEKSSDNSLEKNIASMLSHAYHFFLRKEHNRALDEIARIYLLAPAHERARSLEASIRSAIRGQNGDRDLQKKETAPVQNDENKTERNNANELRRTAISQKVNEIIGRISTLTGEKQYKRALDELTRGYILDPYHPQLKMLEEKIRNEEQNHTNQQNTSANIPVVSVQGRESDTISDRNGKVSQCFKRVNDLLRYNKLEDALNELALVVIIDPFNEEAIKLEKTIIEAQHRQLEERRKTCKEIAAMIAA